MDNAALFERFLESPYCRCAARVLHISIDQGVTPEELARLLDEVDGINQRCRDRLRQLAQRGLTRGRLVDLLDAFNDAENKEELPTSWRDRPNITGGGWWSAAHPSDATPDTLRPITAEGRRIVVELWLRGMETDEIDRYLAPTLRAGDAARVIDTADLPTKPDRCRQVVIEHFRGHYLFNVARHAKVGHETVTLVLTRIGETPHADPKRTEGRLIRQRIRDLSAEHPDASYRQIAAQYKRKFGGDISVDQFKNARRQPKRGPAA